VNRDIPASIKARLLNGAKAAKAEFQLYLVRYAGERFLYRLGASEHRERCVLKGAALLALWLPDPYRTTRDLDFLASGASDEYSIRGMVSAVCAVPCPEDGLIFDEASVGISPIREAEEYRGQRVRMIALLGKARIPFQLDLGFGDAVTPPPVESEFPTLLPELAAPRVRAYRREVTIAEKFEAMVKLGRRNSRMKDFHDLWALTTAFDLDGPTLSGALVACFERRGTPWLEDPPDVLSSAFYDGDELRRRWSDYVTSAAFRAAPPASFEVIGERVLGFFIPLRDHVAAGKAFVRTWQAGGLWR